jgi:hypothetical protein
MALFNSEKIAPLMDGLYEKVGRKRFSRGSYFYETE